MYYPDLPTCASYQPEKHYHSPHHLASYPPQLVQHSRTLVHASSRPPTKSSDRLTTSAHSNPSSSPKSAPIHSSIILSKQNSHSLSDNDSGVYCSGLKTTYHGKRTLDQFHPYHAAAWMLAPADIPPPRHSQALRRVSASLSLYKSSLLGVKF